MSLFETQYKTNPTIFSRKKIAAAAHIYRIDLIDGIEEKKQKLSGWIKGILDGSVTSKKEEAIGNDFLNLFFGEVLDYDFLQGEDQYNLEKQVKNQTDSKKADGALGYFNAKTGEKIIKAIIELKDGQTDLDKPQNRKNDNRTPVQQAFDYASDADGTCNWVIVSNFVEIRLYNYRDRGKYELFYITEFLENELELKRFFYLLYKTQLISKFDKSTIDRKYDERQADQINITTKFYNQYKQLRLDILANFRLLNPQKEPLWLLEKTQKVLDRVIFVCFCEDTVPELIPGDTIKKIVDEWRKNTMLNDNELLWQLSIGLFNSMDKGNKKAEIQPFNGGLFSADLELDALKIDSYTLVKVLDLYKWDFESELNVNILGHIFEQSISDLEDLQAQLSQTEVIKNRVRKKDGVFYTPEYITNYMVEEAIGTWLEERKIELNFGKLQEISLEEYAELAEIKKANTKKKKELDEKFRPQREFWLAYKSKLDKITVLDPACGSGAFLNQTFDYLFAQQKIVSKEIERLFPEIKTDWWEVQRQILMHNLYGVDLNFESVEITKLSLWIKTANKTKPLSFIDNTIKCGNSLIDDIEIAGKKAFDWHKEFPAVFENGGFDVVIGNPPWGAELKQKEWLKVRYKETSFGEINSYKYFIQRTIELANSKGVVCLIQPDSYLEKEYFTDVRTHIYNNASEIKNLKLGDGLFEEVNLPCSILRMSLKHSQKKHFQFIDISKYKKLDLKLEKLTERDFKINKLTPEYKTSFVVKSCYFRKKSHVFLEDIFEQIMGVKVYQIGKGNPKQSTYELEKNIFITKNKKDETYFKFISQGIQRYYYEDKNQFIKYGEWLAEPRDIKYFNLPKIIVREVINESLFATYIQEPAVVKNIAAVIIQKNEDFDLKYLLCLLNSKLFSYCIKNETPKSDNKAFPSINSKTLKKLPIQKLNSLEQKVFIDKANLQLHNFNLFQELKNEYLKIFSASFKLKKLTTKQENWFDFDFYTFNQELKKQKIEIPINERLTWINLFEASQTKIKDIQLEISETDKEIDTLIYSLYELTVEEVKMVEEM